MSQLEFKDWREARGTELERAKHYIKACPTTLKQLSIDTDIPYQYIKDCSYNPDKLNKASWERVHTLAKLDDELFINENISNNMLGFASQLYDFLNKKEEDPKWDAVKREIQKMIITDPMAIAQCQKAYSKVSKK